MIIAQITDLHIVARDRLCYRQIPTNAQLAEAVDHLSRLAPRPDVVIASGDLMEPRAIQLHVLDPGYGLVSHLSYVPSGYRNMAMLESLPEKDRATLVWRTRRDYDDMCGSEYDLPNPKK
jgi:3',5'-cyclic AMP phosphodiesterase CpdA